ncbi:MAG: hypothetical protein LUI61_04790 [Firmicutes bacterium]|nr:hypothetical protein [Bacillota bacterium]
MKNLFMKRNVRMLSFALALMLLLAMALAPRSEASVRAYSYNTDDPTFKVTASLQTDIISGSNYFQTVYGAMRYDATGNGELEIYALLMSINVTGLRINNTTPLEWTKETTAVPVGDYIGTSTTGMTGIDSSDMVYELIGEYKAYLYGTTRFYNPDDIILYAADYT